ncbi:MAG TPA: hypothetical protein VKM55_02565 [Candidatus Lokiarchaeia archaeon]|nr:hypothetical protein [Candidatus Lokiarchaeia archaeon]
MKLEAESFMEAVKDINSNVLPLFQLDTRKSRIVYFLLSTITVLSLRMLENTVHEYAHVIVVLLAGGELQGLPLVTPFGGFTGWINVQESWLPVVNIAGSVTAAIVMLGIFLPVFLKAKHVWMRWIGYWGAAVIPVNIVFYWFMAPFLASSMNYDPIGFAANVGISPAWIVGLIAAIPFCLTVWWMQKATRSLVVETVQDKSSFHWKCLIFYYIISMGFPIISYLNLLDALKFW